MDDEYIMCDRCQGHGVELFCIDDLCHALGECIHGDGERLCPDCDGDGELDNDPAHLIGGEEPS
jgi:hypothetical protein